ncbi:MAG: hypothetical protein V4487_01735 [Chlamydiota bacterium]
MAKKIFLSAPQQFRPQPLLCRLKQSGRLNNKNIVSHQIAFPLKADEKNELSTANHIFQMALPFLIVAASNADFKSLGLNIGKFLFTQAIERGPAAAQFILEQAAPAAIDFLIEHPTTAFSTAWAIKGLLMGAGFRNLAGIDAGFSATVKTGIYSTAGAIAIASGAAANADSIVTNAGSLLYEALTDITAAPSFLISTVSQLAPIVCGGNEQSEILRFNNSSEPLVPRDISQFSTSSLPKGLSATIATIMAFGPQIFSFARRGFFA